MAKPGRKPFQKRTRHQSCGKVRYPDEKRAKSALRTIRTAGAAHEGGKIPVRWYYCDPVDDGCSGYHLTSQE